MAVLLRKRTHLTVYEEALTPRHTVHRGERNRVAELFAMFREVVGPGSESYLPWLMNVVLGRGDGIVGVPYLLTIQRADAAGVAPDRDLRLTQDDADYGVKIRVVAVSPAR